MKKFMSVIAVIFLLCLFACPSLFAATAEFRCSGFLIETGDHQYKIRKYCGEPNAVENVGQKEVTTNNQTRNLNLDDWIYERDGNTYVIRFEGGRVFQIETIK